MSQKPSIPKGTRDFLPEEVRQRKYIFKTIEDVFIKCGYDPIETPTMEALSTLTGKYGEEGDRLLFKVLNNGDYLAKADLNALEKKDSRSLTKSISKRGLRYDLTVPFARFVVMHQNDIAFPFKRYQIQPVWRADRPQKGRYQEFYQCDVDVVGSKSLIYEAELLQIYHEVFRKLNIKVDILLNNRKILQGIAEDAKVADKFVAMTVAIDKLDKIGESGVRKELDKAEINEKSQDIIFKLLGESDLEQLALKMESNNGQEGIQECKRALAYLPKDIKDVRFDASLARGLNYYTGCIFEVKALDVQIGSIGGGGRYDDLTSVFGMKNMPGIGISFGAARIFDVMKALNLFDQETAQTTKVICCYFDEKGQEYAYQLTNSLRTAGIASDCYPDTHKMKKQLKYADDRKIPYVLVIGDNEIESDILSLKNMQTGDQVKLSLKELIAHLS